MSPLAPDAGIPAPSGASFEALHTAFRGRIVAYLRRLAGDPELAEELAQETFARVARGLSGFRGEASPATWIYRIATRVYLDRLRSEAARTADPSSLPPEVVAPTAPGAGLREAPALPDRLLEDSEMGSCLREFVGRLPPAQRTVIVLHDLEGLTNPEIAQVLGCRLETVKIRVHRARRALRALLEEGCELERGADTVLRCDRRQSGGEGGA